MMIRALAPAKINLGLEILGKRADGYHEVDMIMQSIDLCDEIGIEISKSEIIDVLCDKNIDCAPKNNIVYKAAELFFEYTGIKNPGIKINIVKNIPVAAGLAGGSSDAAATLVILDHMFKSNLNKSQLLALGAKLGADVPFCIYGGTARATGLGTSLKRIDNLKNCALVVVKPPISVSTRKAYELSDSTENINIHNFNLLTNAIKNKDLNAVCENLFNRFEEIISEEIVLFIKKDLHKLGACGALMSGSGSAVFGIFENEPTALNCMGKMKKKYPESFLCKPLDRGICIN